METNTTTSTKGGRPLRWLLPLYFALALLFTWATPILEASDEYFHFGVITHIRQQGNLPVQDPEQQDTPYRWEGSQAPLYYLLSTALIAPIDLSDLEPVRQQNPHANLGQPESPTNKNLVLHDSHVPPLEGTALAVYVIRAFGIVLGAVTVTMVYYVTRLLVPGRALMPVLAAGLVAFNPMFLFISASVNNDTLVTALSSAVVLLALLTLRDGFQARRSLLMAVLIALATLTKLSGLVLVPVVAGLALWVAWRDRDWRGLVLLGASMLILWLLLAGWWYARNVILYGELFGTDMLATITGRREEAFTLAVVQEEFEGFRHSFWGVFGLFNIVVPYGWFYTGTDVVTALAGIGLLVWITRMVRRWHQPDARTGLIRAGVLLVLVGIGMAALLNFTAQTYSSQGRLMFPYMGGIAPLMALGLVTLAEQVGRLLKAQDTLRRLALLPLPFLLAASVVLPLTVIAPAYASPEPLESVPSGATEIYANYDGVTLVAYEIDKRRYEPGERLPVTLYWQVEAQTARDRTLFLTLLDDRERAVGQLNSYPGGGLLRTRTWEPGAVYADRYEIAIEPNRDVRTTLQLQVGWWRDTTSDRVEARARDGEVLDAILLDAGVLASEAYTVDADGMQRVDGPLYGNVIKLVGYQQDGRDLQVLWEAVGRPAADYTVFVQALAAGDVAGQDDARPGLPTRFWRAGERFITTHVIAPNEGAPTGEHPVVIGWYDSETGQRLGIDAANDAYELTSVTYD